MIYDKKLMIGAKSKSGVELDAEKAIFKFVLGRHRRVVPMESVEGDDISKFNTKSFISQIQSRFFADF
jgi:hypothetical protein